MRHSIGGWADVHRLFTAAARRRFFPPFVFALRSANIGCPEKRVPVFSRVYITSVIFGKNFFLHFSWMTPRFIRINMYLSSTFSQKNKTVGQATQYEKIKIKTKS